MADTNWALIIAGVLGSGGIGGALAYLAAPGADRLAARADSVNAWREELNTERAESKVERVLWAQERTENKLANAELSSEVTKLRLEVVESKLTHREEIHELRNQNQMLLTAFEFLLEAVGQWQDIPIELRSQIELLPKPADLRRGKTS